MLLILQSPETLSVDSMKLSEIAYENIKEKDSGKSLANQNSDEEFLTDKIEKSSANNFPWFYLMLFVLLASVLVFGAMSYLKVLIVKSKKSKMLRSVNSLLSANRKPAIKKTVIDRPNNKKTDSILSEKGSKKFENIEGIEQKTVSERIDRTERKTLNKESIEKEFHEKDNLEKERLEIEFLEKELLEKKRLRNEHLEKVRFSNEQSKSERIEKERKEQERLEAVSREKERLKIELLQIERMEKMLLEDVRPLKERLKKELLEKRGQN